MTFRGLTPGLHVGEGARGMIRLASLPWQKNDGGSHRNRGQKKGCGTARKEGQKQWCRSLLRQTNLIAEYAFERGHRGAHNTMTTPSGQPLSARILSAVWFSRPPWQFWTPRGWQVPGCSRRSDSTLQAPTGLQPQAPLWHWEESSESTAQRKPSAT